ncbi:sulfur carrier protein ThiS [Janthinobacterium agaricidamnosum]|uniref:Thiamine biosynthesis protein ThiS n=1 Tax=Janthinobacterium agaricidamnosum NBRC 102515 = DSM 9628 TaxID=1349767 RepID=W0VD08_9BURK|nr:sulfur carrier protein ThiS [Janthinobacterium agaricidamnosum]CDG85187.1 thiamine biosynthesis protein ThiS [Janthinobacterium agaricidamnosum NBRC 102515 = DSM 9628]
MIEIVLNGERRQVPPQHTLHDLMTALALENQALALAVNRSVAPRHTWPARILQAQDQVEIVRAIGGG